MNILYTVYTVYYYFSKSVSEERNYQKMLSAHKEYNALKYEKEM